MKNRKQQLGVFATQDELKRIIDSCFEELLKKRNIMETQKICNEIAFSHGLPEISGYYECDLLTGEFIKD